MQRTLIGMVSVFCLCIVVLIAGVRTANASGDPAVTIMPGPVHGSFQSGESVSVEVGSNSLLTPGIRVNIIECADPGGTAANLPTSLNDCDENTVEANTVIVQPNGSFVEHAYQVYSVPNAVLGEQSNWQPVCNATNPCVLYIGEDQNDFTQAKIFSKPFTFAGVAGGTSGAAPTAGATGPTSSSGTGATPSTSPAHSVQATNGANTATGSGGGSDPSSSVASSSSSLAFTGAPRWMLLLAFLGMALVGVGTISRRLLRGGPAR